MGFDADGLGDGVESQMLWRTGYGLVVGRAAVCVGYFALG